MADKRHNLALKIVGGIGAVIVAVIVWIILILSGGFRGLVNNYSTLPDFKQGAPAEQRMKFINTVYTINNQLASISDKKMKGGYKDICERGSNDWMGSSSYLASCTRSGANLYLSHLTTCELVEKLKSTFPTSDISGSDCTKNNTAGDFNTLTLEKDSIAFNLTINDRQATFLNNRDEPVLYRPSDCVYLHAAYCNTETSEFDSWFSTLNTETLPTIILLNYSGIYYQK